MVIGAGIFKAPSEVAANVGSSDMLFAVWLLGGLLSFVGALCYAELSTSFPSTGGDYHFLRLGYGPRLAFLFAWCRFAVINTGSIAGLGFVMGDYTHAVLGPCMAPVLPAGLTAPTLYAAVTIVLLTLVNLRGATSGIDTQMGLTLALCVGLVAVGIAGAVVAVDGTPPVNPQPVAVPFWAGVGLAMVFVLFAFSGWNEIATLSLDVRDRQRGMVVALMLSLGVITALYLLVNWAFWRVLGLGGMAASEAIAADLMLTAFGTTAQWLIFAIVAAAVITSINATIIVGARTTFAAAHDFPALSVLGRWDQARGIPAAAVLAQSAVALLLVGLGAWTQEGFRTLIDYSTPVFHGFLLLTGFGLIVLRVRLPDVPRPFRVPLYPVLPLLFCASIGFVLYSSLAYVLDPARGDLRVGVVAGLIVLGVGVVLLLLLGHPRPLDAAHPNTDERTDQPLG
jgi:amino acid transporter